jgi:hypothetical protein
MPCELNRRQAAWLSSERVERVDVDDTTTTGASVEPLGYRGHAVALDDLTSRQLEVPPPVS